MSEKKVIIIGAGVAGLSAACYLRMNGYVTELFESHNKPGGLCTSWKRKEYTFDGCIHSIGGLNPKFRTYHYLNELIDLTKLKFHFHESLGVTEDENGKIINMYANPDLLKQELLSIAPEDAKFINSLINAVKYLEHFDLSLKKPLELWTPLDYYLNQFRTAPVLPYLIKWRKSMDNLTRNCKSTKLKQVLNTDFFSRFPAYFFIMSLGSLHVKDAGYPIGGSLKFSRLLEEKYLSLGGIVHYKSRVTEIKTKDNEAVSVTLEDGRVHNADIIISASDGHATMLDGKYVDNKIRSLYDKHPRWPSMILVSLGINRSFTDEPSTIDMRLKKELIIDSKTKLDSIAFTIYNFDSTLAPKGKTCVRALLKTDNYAYWTDLFYNNKKLYKQEKNRIAREVIRILNNHFKGLSKQVEVIDVATPVTFKNYTNNWNGSTQGWNWLPGLIPETISKGLPGLKNFYLIGQWTTPGGGIISGLTSGRDITRIICKKDKKKFETK